MFPIALGVIARRRFKLGMKINGLSIKSFVIRVKIIIKTLSLGLNTSHTISLSTRCSQNLPDQTQCYFLCETRGLEACTVTSVPFTHPSHVPPLLAALRQQALFNTLLASCVRTQAKQGTKPKSKRGQPKYLCST